MIVVTGATGNIGRRLVGRLLQDGAQVRALTRDPSRAGLPPAAETVRADLTDAAGLAPLLAGAEALFLNLAAGGEQSAVAVLDAAVTAGVRRVVLNSSVAVTDSPADETNFIARMHAAVERAVRASGLEWTFVRGSNYATNTLGWAASIRESGVVRNAHPGAQGVPVHEADLADVAAVALLDRTGAHAGQAYVVTGPEALTVAEQAAEIGRAIGREVRVEQISEDAAAEAIAGPHMPKESARELIRMFGSTVGRPAPPVSDAVERVTGHPARPFAQWAREHAADFS
ncbi:NAD(P)H-binding protein [Streptomyces natalensis]|uniref:Nucleoside-diphosphate sugar epimerase n=1 Tax=Streptomyces natalensis ATCC 27448 TaxID=1240678 RepID=A0A0D7CED4_9ACTN|nr:NAD(P)H-binding protein [Streptomyces natalensis]KIZ13737.1 nucleoside-diphosphate sugar epimerase [Streptomyces natalensis ATCC 27448]